MRLFVAVDLPDELTDEFEAVQDELREAAGLTFTDPTQAHVTVKFLGETDSGRIDAVTTTLETAIDDAAVDPFECTVGGIGAFPSHEYISVVWAGVRPGAGDRALTRLHESVERETIAIGFEPDSHEFTPHFTLARMKDARGKELVQEALETLDPTIGTFEVRELRLKESTLTPEGPEYRTVERFSL